MNTVEQSHENAESQLATWIQAGIVESASIEKRMRIMKTAHKGDILTVEFCANDIDTLQKKLNKLQHCICMMRAANPQRD